jgi:hypothetical protein|tara:strand:+ start:226 stop:525 length:300 start_codon:yes stop_codon:yes gene_type:complete
MGKLADYITEDKISKPFGKYYRCGICNFHADTPFEAMKCYDRCESLKLANISDAQKYWVNLDRNQMLYYRNLFNKLPDIEYNSFETVADFAYSLSVIKP